MTTPAGPSARASDPSDMIERRRALLGGSYRLFYREPVHPVRAEGVMLYDAEGRTYLDAYNNVPVVGHCHPRVVAAVQDQVARLNTHTRYLDETILAYSERLLATLPDPIGQVMYACTGSEAVDLALRVARHHTGQRGVVVTANAYHGTSTATAGMSPLLGAGVPLDPAVRTVALPREGETMGATFADNVRAAFADLRRHGFGPAAFIADGIFSSDGVRAEPRGFLAPVAEAVREAGAVYIADEVQAGFARTGDAMWSFARHGVVPDLVAMGKPMGNGMPIAAVAMDPAVGERFGREVRYFNTFGANHVSLAAAGAVLDVIESDRLQANAECVGAYLREGLKTIAASFAVAGAVRGAGLYAALDLRCSDDPEPARADAELAADVVERLREKGILIGASGPGNNTLKIRPPLPFSRDHADRLLEALRISLAEVA